jgi:hypothetical protein
VALVFLVNQPPVTQIPIAVQILFLEPLHLLVVEPLAITVWQVKTVVQVVAVDGVRLLLEQEIRHLLVHHKEIMVD